MFKLLGQNFFKTFSKKSPSINLFQFSTFQKLSQSKNKFHKLTLKNFSTPSFDEYMKTFEKNMKESQRLSSELLTNLKLMNEQKITQNMECLNKLGIRFNHLTEVRNFVTTNIEKIPLTNPESLVTFFQFVDKLELENFEAEFSKILPVYSHFIEKGLFSIHELVMVIYAYSKYQIINSDVWLLFYKQLEGKIHTLPLENITQLLLAFTMAQSLAQARNEFLIEEEKLQKIYKEIFSQINEKIQNLTYLDTFRICISMTKRPVNVTDIPQNVWTQLQNNFIKDITAFDIYQMSQILLLFCETPYLNLEIFKAVESEVTKEYLENLEELIKTVQMEPTAFMEDLSKISFAFALSRQGSQYFWNLVLKTFIKYKSNMSILTLENLLFVSYRLIDYLPGEFKSQNNHQEPMKNLYELFNHIEEKIITEKLLENNKVDPFNAMMPFARFGNTNEKIWSDLTKNVTSVLSKVKSINPFLINDIIFAFSNYYSNLIIARDREEMESMNKNNSDKNMSNNFKAVYYLKNFENFWNKIEELILSLDEKALEVPHVANMIIDLSQIDLELSKAWKYLTEILKGKLEKFDQGNFVLILMGYSKKDYKDPNIWKVLQSYAATHLNEFSIEELRKIVLSFLKHKELNKEFWLKLQERFSHSEILNKFTLEYFIDLQIPFTISGIHNEKIWQKFEELVFRNLKTFENDKDFFMNTLYSFSRSGRGSVHLWTKFAQIIQKELNSYDIDDLGHISVCLRPSNLKNFQIENLLDEKFWQAFVKNVESKINSGKLNSLNNLLRGINENEYLSKDEKLVRIVEDRIAKLLKDLPREN
jgi:hypothetical protein